MFKNKEKSCKNKELTFLVKGFSSKRRQLFLKSTCEPLEYGDSGNVTPKRQKYEKNGRLFTVCLPVVGIFGGSGENRSWQGVHKRVRRLFSTPLFLETLQSC
jgi:hypothetical protein